MYLESYLVSQIDTLKIYSYTERLTKRETVYLSALNYLFRSFENMEKDNTFCMYLNEKEFLIANHKDGEKINPIVFVNKNGNLLFEVNIQIFSKAMKEFDKYIDFAKSKHKDYPEDKIIKKAILDYKNDKLDFYANSSIVRQSIINQARKELSEKE